MQPNARTNPLQGALEQFRSNPLINALPRKLNALELATSLRYCPITPNNVKDIPICERHHLVNIYKSTFIPTTQSLSIALALQQMLYDGYAQRDPALPSSKKFIYSGGLQKGIALSKTEWWPSYASGIVLTGITGLGKSQLVERLLSLFPQTIEHGESQLAGWKSLKQLCWLKIHMPSDGSRGGFLEGAFRELDKVLGTDYCRDYSPRSWSVEKLLVVFLHLLSVHRCGLLVIEEAQERNLRQSPFSREFLTFFLRILNWGIPTALIGNPLAFEHLRTFSQDVDRFSEGGWHHLLPTMDPASEEWIEDWVSGLWCPTLLDLPDAEFSPVPGKHQESSWAEFVWRRTAGVPRYVARLRMEVQDAALRMALPQVTTELVDRVYQSSPKMAELRPRIDAFVNKDWRALKHFSDIPWPYFQKVWAPRSPEAEGTSDREPEPSNSSISGGASDTQSKHKRERKATKANPTGKTLSDAELQAKQFQNEAIRQLAEASGVPAK